MNAFPPALIAESKGERSEEEVADETANTLLGVRWAINQHMQMIHSQL